MGSVSVKDVFPSLRATHDISAVWLHKDVNLSGPLCIIERCPYRSSCCLSAPGMSGSATPRDLPGGLTFLIWFLTHVACPSYHNCKSARNGTLATSFSQAV